MDLWFLFFKMGPAMNMIFSIGYIPKEEDFKELTPQQYEMFRLKVPGEERRDLENQRILAFLPDNPKVYSRVVKAYGNDLVIVGPEEMDAFERVREIIDNYCSDSKQAFEDETEKLIYMAKVLPNAFSEGTPFAIHALNKPWKKNNKP